VVHGISRGASCYLDTPVPRRNNSPPQLHCDGGRALRTSTTRKSKPVPDWFPKVYCRDDQNIAVQNCIAAGVRRGSSLAVAALPLASQDEV
jgi:hypothetical protein